MKGTKEYRFKDNPLEKKFHDEFIDYFTDTHSVHKALSGIVNGWSNNRQDQPNEWLTKKEEIICVNLIQWLGSPVGIGFLRDCGFLNHND